MLRRLTLLAAVALCALPAVAHGAQSHPRELTSSSCNVVRVSDRAYVMYRLGVPCSWAKHWVQRLHASGGHIKPAGFSCTSGSKFRGGGWCERGGKHFGWDPS